MRKAFFFGFTNNVMDIRKWARSRKNNSSVTRDNSSMRDSHGECTKTDEMVRTLQVEKRTRVIIIQLNRRFCMILPSATTRELDKTTVEHLGGMIEPKQVVLEKSRWKRSVLSEVLFLARKVLFSSSKIGRDLNIQFIETLLFVIHVASTRRHVSTTEVVFTSKGCHDWKHATSTNKGFNKACFF